MMEPRIVKQSEVDNAPYIIWNIFIDIVACGDMSDMSDIQKKAALCFWYDSELQNGGHLQYFENTSVNGVTDYQEVVAALKQLGAIQQAEILSKAISVRDTEKRGFIKTVNEFADRAREGLYDSLDKEYYDCSPDIVSLLQNMLEKHQSEFITIES